MSKVFSSPLVQVPVSILLLVFLFFAGQSIVETFVVAEMTTLTNLRPSPIEYLWEVNIRQAPLDKSKIRLYVDYYERLLQVFPELREANGLLGYCYHYLNDDPKAIKFLRMAIENDPDYFWNYYNLAVIDVSESRYRQGVDLLQKAVKMDLQAGFKRLFLSGMVYLPLFEGDQDQSAIEVSQHLKEGYQMGFALAEILNEAAAQKKISAMTRKFHPELYAF